MSEQYTVDYFIEKFTAIPEERWCEQYFEKPDVESGVTKRCVLGQLGTTGNHCWPHFPRPAMRFGAILKKFAAHFTDQKPIKGTVIAAMINNGWCYKYQQPTPRARILAALQDIKAKSNKGEL